MGDFGGGVVQYYTTLNTLSMPFFLVFMLAHSLQVLAPGKHGCRPLAFSSQCSLSLKRLCLHTESMSFLNASIMR